MALAGTGFLAVMRIQQTVARIFHQHVLMGFVALRKEKQRQIVPKIVLLAGMALVAAGKEIQAHIVVRIAAIAVIRYVVQIQGKMRPLVVRIAAVDAEIFFVVTRPEKEPRGHSAVKIAARCVVMEFVARN